MIEQDNNLDSKISHIEPNSQSNSIGSSEVPIIGQIKPQKAKISFKEQWEKSDQLCPHCNNVTVKAEGINRQNMKRLFSFKHMTMNDIVIFALTLMLLASVYRYYSDTASCKTFLASGTQLIWQDIMDSGVPLDSLLASAKAKTQLNPLLLNSELGKQNLTLSGGS